MHDRRWNALERVPPHCVLIAGDGCFEYRATMDWNAFQRVPPRPSCPRAGMVLGETAPPNFWVLPAPPTYAGIARARVKSRS